MVADELLLCGAVRAARGAGHRLGPVTARRGACYAPAMLIDDIKRRIAQAMKAGDTVEKEVLRVALGEIQTADARGASGGDEASAAVLRKLVKSNQETLALAHDDDTKSALLREIAVLESLLPKTPGVEELVAALAASRDAIRAAANDGAATGVAMKALKAAGVAASGKDVAEAVKRLRA